MKPILLVLKLSSGAEESDASAEVGTRARLPCVVDPVKCGDVHSIKWYKNIHRVFVFSELAKISRSEGPLAKRSGLEYYRNHTESYLVIETVESADEGMYKCEITYLEVREECQGVQFVDFKTLIKPDSVVISKEDGTELKNGTILGPLTEGDEILLTCKAVGGRPVPRVQWWNGTSPLLGDYLDDLGEPVDSGRSSVRISVSRGDLGVNFECRAYHPTIEGHFTKFLQLEVDVRPNRIELSGVGEHVIQGNRVVLQCVVRGARPAANVTWYNGTVELQESSSAESLQGDGTYDTISRLEFIATRFENEQTLSCEATNEIMSSRHEEPLRESVTLEVMYPPIVTVAPGNVTVNESTDILMFCHYEANPASLKTVKWLRDEEEFELDTDHFEGGTIEQTTLLIKNSTRHDIGAYTCMLGNEVGVSQSHNSVEVSVYFKPLVNLTITPPSPVTEVDRVNITMVCQVAAGNPDTLLAVRWFLDGQILKELPDCADDDSLFCDIDPSKLLLQDVARSFHGNYSCMGKNLAGWGPMSADTELVVYYPPSPANLTFSPSRVVKRGAVTLSCTVADLGRPDNTTYRWMRGGHTVVDVTTANWTVDPVTLETEANFTCAAVNLGGESEPAVVYIKVFAPPTFINRLPPYYGALMTSQSISITCRVECSPLCTITWQKNGHQLETGPHGRYYVLNSLIPPDTRTNDFESVQSTLVWNMTAWPGGVLDRLTDNANYTCLSTGNAVGSGVKSTTFFAVEYPPENLTVSNKVVNVIEGNVPEKVLCNAKAYPEPSFQWRREGDADIIIKGNALILNYPVPRRNGGNYICEAYNRHGNNTKIAYINVLYRPECGITKKEVDGKLVLVCQAHANPPEVDFSWKIKNENETIEDNIEKSGLQSLLTLETRVENFRTYLCFANNSVGMSIPCEMDVTGSVSWWARLERENLMILIAIIAGIILMVIIICVIIIIVCRRKRAADKYNTHVELEDRENPEGSCSSYNNNNNNNNNNNINSSCDGEPLNSPGGVGSGNGGAKWPLRPGVLVHVNTNHSLLSACSGAGTISGTATIPPRYQRGPPLINESQASRASRIKAMFSQDSGGTFPGVFQSKSGVVTFKRLDPTMDANSMSRKRKKPGASTGPNTGGPNKDPNSSPNDALLPPDPDKAFYENLPFHNMQNPPNKTIVASRPPSRISSGYGSARSHRPLRPVRKFLTVRPLGGRPRNWPQFRSLRLGKSNAKGSTIPPTPAPRIFYPKSSPINHSYQNVPLPKVIGDNPTKEKTIPHESMLPSNQPKTESINGVVTKEENSDVAVHNKVEKVVEENKVSTSNTEGKAPDERESGACTVDLTRQYGGGGSGTGGRGCSTGGRTKRKHHHHHHHGGQQQRTRGSSGSGGSELDYTAPPPLIRGHRTGGSSVPASPPSAKFNGGGGTHVYQPPPHRPSAYTTPRTHTEYTFIKFHDVGQEIDV